MVNRLPTRRVFTALTLTAVLAGASIGAFAQKPVELLNVARPGNLWVVFDGSMVQRVGFSSFTVNASAWTSHLPTGQACVQPLRGA